MWTHGILDTCMQSFEPQIIHLIHAYDIIIVQSYWGSIGRPDIR
jgi:hypothetical protein